MKKGRTCIANAKAARVTDYLGLKLLPAVNRSRETRRQHDTEIYITMKSGNQELGRVDTCLQHWKVLHLLQAPKFQRRIEIIRNTREGEYAASERRHSETNPCSQYWITPFHILRDH